MTGSRRSGAVYAIAAYGMWGFLPLYFALVAPMSPFELVGWRIILSVAFCVVLLVLLRGWRNVGALVRDPIALVVLGVAGLLIACNWLVYVYAVLSGHTVEGALGYFLNPIVSVVLALVVLRERLRPLQWAAVGVALLAVVVLAIGYGQFPWLSIVLAFSFGLYGLVKKRVGARAEAIPGFFVETTLLIPLALVCLWASAEFFGGLTFGQISTAHTVTVLFAGVITSLPLLCFAAAAKRLTLVEVGMLQFIAPIVQFLIGVFLFGEAMPLERWLGFVIVWVALAFFVVDLVRAQRKQRAEAEPGASGASGTSSGERASEARVEHPEPRVTDATGEIGINDAR